MVDRRRIGAAAIAALAGVVAFCIATAPANAPVAAAGTATTADPSLSPQTASTTASEAITSTSAASPTPAGTPAPTAPPTATAAPALSATPVPTATPIPAASTTTPSSTPSATPCEALTPTPSPTSLPTPSPSPSAKPSACANPTLSPAGSPVPAQISQATAGGGPNSAGPATSPASTATPIAGTVIAGDPLLTTQVQAILANPVAAQRPDLMHFKPPYAGGGGAPSGGAGPGSAASPGGSPAPFALRCAALALLLVAGLLTVVLRRRAVGRRLMLTLPTLPLAVATPAAIVAALIAANGGQARMPAAASVTVAPVITPPGSVLSGLRSHTVSVPVGTASRTWTSLVTIEMAVASQHDRVISDEQQITAITQQLAAAARPSAPPERPADPALLKGALQQAVADHQTDLSSYDASLKKEYMFFVSTVQSPEASTELQSVAAHTPPDVQKAIATNLELVRTQLQQEAAIAAAAAEAQRQAAAAGQADTSLSGPAPAFHAPVSGVVSQPFGPTQFALEPPLTYNSVFYQHFHTGLDIAAPLDTPLQAAASGTVLLATSSLDSQGHLTGYGNYVVISHGNGYLTLYGHLDKLMVVPGQTVQQGQVIGLLGSTGFSTGPHVHFEIRKDGVFVDPAPYLAAARAG